MTLKEKEERVKKRIAFLNSFRQTVREFMKDKALTDKEYFIQLTDAEKRLIAHEMHLITVDEKIQELFDENLKTILGGQREISIN